MGADMSAPGPPYDRSMRAAQRTHFLNQPKGTTMKQILLNCTIAATLLAATHPATAGPPRDVSAEIGAMRGDIVSAKVFHLPDSMRFRTARDETFVANGCFYAASGDDLSTLLGVLVSGGLHETPRTPDGFDEVRTIVYLAKRDGSTVSLLLDTRAPGMPSYGSYDRTVPVAADGTFSTALHAWMTPRTKIRPDTSEPCISTLHID